MSPLPLFLPRSRARVWRWRERRRLALLEALRAELWGGVEAGEAEYREWRAEHPLEAARWETWRCR